MNQEDENVFQTLGAAVFYEDSIKLVPDIPDKNSFFFAKEFLLAKETWVLEFTLRFSSSSEFYSEGLAFWIFPTLPSESNLNYKTANKTMFGYDVRKPPLFPISN